MCIRDRVKYAATKASLDNIAKNYDGQLTGFKRIDAAGQKHAEEAQVLALSLIHI